MRRDEKGSGEVKGGLFLFFFLVLLLGWDGMASMRRVAFCFRLVFFFFLSAPALNTSELSRHMKHLEFFWQSSGEVEQCFNVFISMIF